MFGVFATYTLKNPSISQDGPPQPSDISDEMICIYDDRSPDTTLKLINPKLTLADNSAGSFTFSITPDSVIFGKLIRMRTEIMVARNGFEIWSGRIVSEESDFYGNHAFTCEGELAYLNDILQPPSAYDDVTIDQFLGSVLANYNAKADSHRQFTLGIVSGNWMIHPGDFGFYQDVNTTANMSNTWEVIKNTLLDVYGGHLRIRKDGGVRYLDYLNDYPNLSEQIIDFGVNLLDFTRNWDETELATVIYPRGKKLEDEDENDGITGKITKTRHKSNNQYDVEFNLTWINHGVPRDGKYDYIICLSLHDPRYIPDDPEYDRFHPAIARSDIWTLDPGNDSNQSWTYLIRDFEPTLQYRYEAWVEYRRHKDDEEDVPNYNWDSLPEPYHLWRDIDHAFGTHDITAMGDRGLLALSGSYTVSYYAMGGSDFEIDVEMTFINPGTPGDGYYDYRLVLILEDPVRGNIRKYGNVETLAPGDTTNVTGYANFTGLNNNRSYGISAYVDRRRSTNQVNDVWKRLGGSTPIVYGWESRPDPYQMYRQLENGWQRYELYADDAQHNHVLEGWYFNSYYMTGGTEYETTVQITYHNPGNPTANDDYEYRIEFVLVNHYHSGRDGIRKYGDTTVVRAGRSDDITGLCRFTGLETNFTYGLYVIVQYRKKESSTSQQNIYYIEHTFDAHFTDGELDGVEKRVGVQTVNNNLDYVENTDTVATYGRLEKVVTWDYIEDPAKLLALARWYLSDYQFNNMVLSVNALDLNYLDVSYDRIQLLDRVKAVSRPHGMNHEFPVTKLDIPLDHPENTTFTLGDKPRDSYTASVGNDTNDIYDQLGAIPTSGDILKEIGSAGYKVLQRAKENARMILDSRTNGTITIVEGDDGYSDAIYFTETKDYTEATRFWRWNMNGLGFYNNGVVEVGITNDGAINANLITVGQMLVDRIRLYGLMGVYNQQTGGNVGGFIGYGEGSRPVGNTYVGTPGIMISNTKRTTGGVEEPGYLRYFIATDSGVRMQAGAQSFYLNDDYVDGKLSGTGELITSNAFTFNVGGIHIYPPWEWSDQDWIDHNPGVVVNYDEGLNGWYPLGNGGLRFYKGFLVNSNPFGGISQGDTGSEVQLGKANIIVKNGLVTHITPWTASSYQSEIDGVLAIANKSSKYFKENTGDSTFTLQTKVNDTWYERIKASSAGTTIRAGDKNYVTANNSTFEAKAREGVVLYGNSNEIKISKDDRNVTLKESEAKLEFDSNIWINGSWDTANNRGGCHMHAGSFEWYVSTATGPGPFPSDKRFKKDISYDLDGDLIDDLKPVIYKFKDTDEDRFGFIAQDVQEVVPNLVKLDTEGKRLYLHYNDIIAILTAKVQKQSKKIQDLEDRIARLESLVLDKVKE